MISKIRPTWEEVQKARKERRQQGKPGDDRPKKTQPAAKRAKPPRAFNRKMGAKGSDYKPGGAIDSEIRIEGPNADSDA